MKKIILSLLVLMLLSILCVTSYTYYVLFYAQTTKEGVFVIPQGASVKNIAVSLEQQGYIKNAFVFSLYTRLRSIVQRFRAGSYAIEKGITASDIATLFASGKMLMVKITIPEGLPWWEVEKRFEKAGMVESGAFASLIRDKSFIASLGLPYDSLEGFLYPDTYTFAKPAALGEEITKNILQTMVRLYREKTANIYPAYLTEEERYKALILASVVEKEAQREDEKPIIAGVYWNRLAKGMLLQADPTLIYGIGESFSGDITREDLRNILNPYNTYVRRGLPPTPICSPSVATLKATLSPTKHSFYYFVATKLEGRHKFSETLEEHNKAVRKYQLNQ